MELANQLMMWSTDKAGAPLATPFWQEAAAAGFPAEIIAAAIHHFTPWLRRRPLSLNTLLYEDLGIVDDDLEELVFALWECLLGRRMTPEEIVAFAEPLTVKDILDRISHARGCERPAAT